MGAHYVDHIDERKKKKRTKPKKTVERKTSKTQSLCGISAGEQLKTKKKKNTSPDGNNRDASKTVPGYKKNQPR